MTDPEYQSKKMMSKLFNYMIMHKYNKYNFEIGTYEGNDRMISIINKYNFKLKDKKKDRIDGRRTFLYLLNKNSHYAQ